MKKARRQFLCRLDELQDPGSIAKTLVRDGRDCNIFLVRSRQRVYGYLNSCPHTGSPLDWTPGHFLSADRRHIQCATHAALFQIDDGFCVSGPCSGERLCALPLEVESGNIYLLAGQGEGLDGAG